MKIVFVTLFIFISFLTAVHAGEIYNCIDRDGNTILTDAPQDGMKCVPRGEARDQSARPPQAPKPPAIPPTAYKSDVYAQNCHGPFDYNKVNNEYKSIVDEYASENVNDIRIKQCTSLVGDIYTEHILLLSSLQVWECELFSQTPAGKRYQNIRDGAKARSDVIKTLNIDFLENHLKNKYSGRYYNWLKTKVKIENYFKNHPVVKKRMEADSNNYIKQMQ